MNIKFYILITIIIILFIPCNKFSLYSTSDLSHMRSKAKKHQNSRLIPKDTIGIDTQIFIEKLALLFDGPSKKWPVKAPFPLKGALLPYYRIVAYYGNFYTAKLGILGLKPENQMLLKLKNEVSNWNKVDSLTPVIPAIHYLAVTAQTLPGKDQLFCQRMPPNQIQRAVDMARILQGIAILDVQVGQSTVQKEIPNLEKFLSQPDVHLGLDPEWSMKKGAIPGTKIGTMDAKDINYAIEYLADIVTKYNLPPKILIVHRFTKGMITNYQKIRTCREVQVVINMDGFGYPAKKITTYRHIITAQPVQFAGFKLFYKNDIKSKPFQMLTPKEILQLNPKPSYIQYQ